ncbi:TPA: hypothetical protein P2I01_004542 [Aeromonas salmonicida]|uniref:hypothetical protein n=1 Tax=Aeromonas salmonicida TaxID=645 RepID=UPI003311C1E6|nr:hypothetical protein [Aeromonas salmonicida]
MQQMQQVEPAVGRRYRVIRPAESVEDIDGCLVHFEQVEFVAEVLKKPEKVIAFDGYKKEVEPLPEHLKAPEWLLIRKLRTGRTQWLHRETCQLVALP